MSKRINVVETEKSAAMVGRLWRQRKVLKTELQVLDRAQQTVAQRITLNQRVTYKRHKDKLYHSKLTLAKIMGDRQAEREIRAKAKAYKFNTNFGQDPEDEEVLQKIWSRSPVPAQGLESEGRGPSRARPIGSAPPRMRSAALSRPAIVPRPLTVAGHINRASPPGKGQYICTGADGESAGSDHSDDNDSTTSSSTGKLRPKTAPVTVDRKLQRPLSAAPASREIPAQQKRGTVTLFLRDNSQPTLLDIHRQRLKMSNYENQVSKMCDRMEPYRMQKDYLIEDYYAVCLDFLCREDTGENYCRTKAPEESARDIRRATGDINARGMTIKELEGPYFHRCTDLS